MTTTSKKEGEKPTQRVPWEGERITTTEGASGVPELHRGFADTEALHSAMSLPTSAPALQPIAMLETSHNRSPSTSPTSDTMDEIERG